LNALEAKKGTRKTSTGAVHIYQQTGLMFCIARVAPRGAIYPILDRDNASSKRNIPKNLTLFSLSQIGPTGEMR
jgi:hypothetical protein